MLSQWTSAGPLAVCMRAIECRNFFNKFTAQGTSSPLKKSFRARNRPFGGQRARREARYDQYDRVSPDALALKSRSLASKALFQRAASRPLKKAPPIASGGLAHESPWTIASVGRFAAEEGRNAGKLPDCNEHDDLSWQERSTGTCGRVLESIYDKRVSS